MNYTANEFEGTHLDEAHIGEVAAKRIAGLVAARPVGYTPGSGITPVAQLLSVPLASLAVVSAGAEASNVRTVTFQLYDANGEALRESRFVELELLDGATHKRMADADATITGTATGTVGAGDESAIALGFTDANGAIVVDVEDLTTSLAGAMTIAAQVVDGRSLGKTVTPIAFT